MLMSYLKLIGTALAALTNIRSLERNLASVDYVSILEHVTLPRMYKFATRLPFTPELISFLNRHTAIRDLVLVPVNLTINSDLPPVPLADLKHVRTVFEIMPT